MKKKKLFIALTSLALLTACGDDPEQPKANNDNAVIQQEHAAEDHAEKVFVQLTQSLQAAYQTFLGTHPMIDAIDYQLVSYEKKLHVSSAVTKVTIHLMLEMDGRKSFDLTFNHRIHHDAQTRAQGLVARIETKVHKPADMDAESAKLAGSFTILTDIRDDKSLVQLAQLHATTLAGGRDKLMFKGFVIESHSTLADLKDGFGTLSIRFDGMKGDDFSVGPTGLVSEYQRNGDFRAEMTAPLMLTAEDAVLSIGSFKANGNLMLNKAYDKFVGKMHYEWGQILVENILSPMVIAIKSQTVDSDSAIDDGILSQSGRVQLIPEAGVDLTSAFFGSPLTINAIDASYRVANVPASVLQDYQQLKRDAYASLDSGEDYDKQVQQKTQAMFNKLREQGGQLLLKLDIASAAGNVRLDTDLQFNTGSDVALKDIKRSPMSLAKLFTIRLDASMPAGLLEQKGWQTLAGPLLIKEGKTYKSHIESDDETLLINGIPLPQ